MEQRREEIILAKIFLCFDFYGAGNIGDDLMLDGFLSGIKNNDFEFSCALPRDCSHQQFRFPRIKFVNEKYRDKIASESRIWLGVGDTPVQLKSGSWMLDKLTGYSELKKEKNVKYFFIGVGAEKEALAEKEKFRKAIDEVDYIWTRDKFTTELLTKDFQLSEDKVETSSDLANISLSKIFSDTSAVTKIRYDAGICYFDENFEQRDFKAVKDFVLKYKKRKKKILFFGNDVNIKGRFEYKIYQQMFSKIEKFVSGIKYYQPDYFGSESAASLVSYYRECDLIITSRYHSLLTAAWAGCRVIALERSSKVSALAKELGIREVKKPYDSETILELSDTAERVDKTLLQSLSNKALCSINALEKKISSIE